jgi:hypothetical protein
VKTGEKVVVGRELCFVVEMRIAVHDDLRKASEDNSSYLLQQEMVYLFVVYAVSSEGVSHPLADDHRHHDGQDVSERVCGDEKTKSHKFREELKERGRLLTPDHPSVRT